MSFDGEGLETLLADVEYSIQGDRARELADDRNPRVREGEDDPDGGERQGLVRQESVEKGKVRHYCDIFIMDFYLNFTLV